MKALTICQPYATLIILGRKLVENRTWPTNYRGPLLIHAGKSKKYLDYSGADLTIAEYYSVPFGVILGVADLVACIRPADVHANSPLPCVKKLIGHIHVEGPNCFVLENVRQFEKPIPYIGAQGLFDVPDEIVAEQMSSLPTEQTA